MGKSNHFKNYGDGVDDFTSHEDRKDRRAQRKQKDIGKFGEPVKRKTNDRSRHDEYED